jgi:carboxyl-terminal processing protease
LLSLLAGRADETRHITILDGGGHVRTVTLQLERRFDRSPGPLSEQILPGDIGLIRFNNSLGDQKTVAAFDAALELLKSTRGLVLDLRDVPSGGDSSVALGIMGRFTTTMLPYQHHRVPNYGQPDVERNWFELVAPRGPFTYTQPVVVLVDHWTGSMGEGMAIGFDGMHRAVVVGTPMAHLAGAVDDFHLPKTGIDVAFADEQLYHVDGTPRQDWLPPVLVGEESVTAPDPILSVGLRRMEEMIASPSPNSVP